MVKMVGKSMAKLGGQKDGNHLDGMQYLSPATSYYHSDVEQTRPYMGTMTMNA